MSFVTCEIQISESVTKFCWNPAVLSAAASAGQEQRWIVAMEIVELTKLKIFTMGPFAGKAGDP